MSLIHSLSWVRLRQTIAVVLCILALAFLIGKWVITSKDFFYNGYVGYYAATRIWIEKQGGAQIYDPDWYAAYTRSLTNGQISEVFGPNLPTMQVIALPSAFFPLLLAHAFWITENIILMGLGIFFLTISIRPVQEAWFYLLFVAFYLFFPPLIRNIESGQAYLIVFFFLALALYGFQNEKAWLVGFGLALAFMLKSAGLFLWSIPLLNRNWKVLGWSVGIALCLTIVTLPRIGVETWAAYPQALLNAASNGALTVTAYQSIPGFLNHLFRYDEAYNPAPLLNAPVIAQILIYVTSIASLGFTLWRIRNASEPIQVATLLTLNTMLVPLVEEHQLVLLLIPITILAVDLLTHPPSQPTAFLSLFLFITGVLLLALRLPYKSPALYDGWLSFLAYPRLYGSSLLWVFCLLRIRPTLRVSRGLASSAYVQ